MYHTDNAEFNNDNSEEYNDDKHENVFNLKEEKLKYVQKKFFTKLGNRLSHIFKKF